MSTSLRSAPRALLFLLLMSCGDGFLSCSSLGAACPNDGTPCGTGLACEVTSRTCRGLCTTEADCLLAEWCAEQNGLNICRPTETGCAVGAIDCRCRSNGACDQGLSCRDGFCLSVRGQANRPCRVDGTCLDGLACRSNPESGDSYCRILTQGGAGQDCYDELPFEPRVFCAELDLACDGTVCKRGREGACDENSDCRNGLECVDMQCADLQTPDAGIEDMAVPDMSMPDASSLDMSNPDAAPGDMMVPDMAGSADLGNMGPADSGIPPCTSKTDCGMGQFCCGEVGTQYDGAGGSCTPMGQMSVSVGACFDAPGHPFNQLCRAGGVCAGRVPVPVGTSTATAMCMPWGTSRDICSVPCENDLGCPRDWRCDSGFAGCTSDAECGDNVCEIAMGASVGRCRCDLTASDPVVACTHKVRSGPTVEYGTCVSVGGRGYCEKTRHCIPPGF